MTFYNIIFGLLFIGAFREVIYYSLGEWNPGRFCLAAILSVLVFSDTIYTSLVIEGMKKRYRMPMKLLDLLSFLILSFAVVLLNPVSNDMFEVNASERLQVLMHSHGTLESWFWVLLALYMIVLFAWNARLELHGDWKPAHPSSLVQPGFAAVFFLLAWLTWLPSEGGDFLVVALRWIILVAVLFYLVLFKSYYARKLAAPVVEVKALTDSDAAAIYQWPSYQGRLNQLSYALRQDGWLRDHPVSSVNRRYGLWHEDDLVGFSLLTDIKNGEAEFYIALRADMLSQRLGPEATRQIVCGGFKDLKLRRIYLKVRQWHKDAQGVYADCGFRAYKKETIVVRNKPTDFILMERHRMPFGFRWLVRSPEQPAQKTENVRPPLNGEAGSGKPTGEGTQKPEQSQQ